MIAVHPARQPIARMKVAAIEHISAVEKENCLSVAPIGKIDTKAFKFGVAEETTAVLAAQAGVNALARILVEEPEPRHGGVVYHQVVFRHAPAEPINLFLQIEAVGYRYAPLEIMLVRYDPAKMNPGLNVIAGEEVFFIPNPAQGLWAHRDRFWSPQEDLCKRELAHRN